MTVVSPGCRYDSWVVDSNNQLVPGASIAVFISGTSTPAALYTDRALTLVLANPFNTDSYGNFGFWALAGCYTVQITNGSQTYSYPVELGSPDDSDDAVTTVINPDGSITETHTATGLVVTTTFGSDGSIVETFGAPVSKTKTTTFSADGATITETIS